MDIKYLKNVGIYLLTAILSLVVIWYIVYQATNGFSADVETMSAALSTERSTLTLEAYVMRQEKVLYSRRDGVVNPLYADGERVRSRSVVAQVYESGSSEAGNRIMEIDEKISVLEASDISESITLSDTTTLDSSIAVLLNKMRYRIAVGDTSYALQKTNELLTMLNKRSIIVTSDKNGYADLITRLKDEKESLTRTMSGLSAGTDVVTSVAGYFYSEVDGYEELFSSSKITFMTLDEFDTLIHSKPDEFLLNNTNGKGICKVVTTYKWYIACEITRDQLKNFGEGYTYTVIFPYSGDVELKMKLERILSESENDRIVLFFSSGSIQENFNFLRHQTVEIVDAEYTGYRVPVSSVRVVNGRQGVYTLTGNTIDFKEIVPLAEFNGYLIVEEQDAQNDELYYRKLALNDLIVTRGKNLYAGKIVE